MTVTSDPLAPVAPPPEATVEELALLQKLRNAYKEAYDSKRMVYAHWRRNWLLLNNKMWSDVRQDWMPAPTDSEIYPTLANLIGWLTDQSVEFSISPATRPGTMWAQFLQSLADDLGTLIQSNWKLRNQTAKITLALWDAALYGAGILKAVWDQSLDSGKGDADISRVDPWNFYVDPNATNLENASFIFELRRMSFEEIERRFPDASSRLLSDMVYNAETDSLDSDTKPTNSNRTNVGQASMSVSGGYPTQATSSYGRVGQGRLHVPTREGILVTECWYRENRTAEIPDPHFEAPQNQPDAEAPMVEVTYDDWRVVVFTHNTILLDAWASDLWEGATHPYGRVPFEDTGEFWPTPLVSHLAPCQIAINRLLASLQQSAELTGNPIMVQPASSRMGNTLLQNRPGQIVKDSSQQPNGGPRWMQPPQMSPDVLTLVRFYIERMENIAGTSTVSKGRSAAPRTPEAVVSQVQESGFVRVRSVLRNLEHCLRKIGGIMCELIVENYTEPRNVAILGQEDDQHVVMLRARHFLDHVDNEYEPFKYSLIVNAGSEVPTSRQARISEAIQFFGMKAIDAAAVLEVANFPHWRAVVDRMQQAEQAQVQTEEKLIAAKKRG